MPVSSQTFPVAFYFTADGGVVTIEAPSNFTITQTMDNEMMDDIAVIIAKMCIGHGRFLIVVGGFASPTLSGLPAVSSLFS